MTRSTCIFLTVAALAVAVSARRVASSKGQRPAGWTYAMMHNAKEPATFDPVDKDPPSPADLDADADADEFRRQTTGKMYENYVAPDSDEEEVSDNEGDSDYEEDPESDYEDAEHDQEPAAAVEEDAAPLPYWDYSVGFAGGWRNRTTGQFSKPPKGQSKAGFCAFPPWKKVDCGAELAEQKEPSEVQKKECLAKGCCYKDIGRKSLEPWCFHKESTCSMEDGDKEECGYYGIQWGECVDRGCCWQPMAKGDAPRTKEPWCFKPKGAVLKQSERPRPPRKKRARRDTGANTENAQEAPKLSLPEVEWVYGEDGESCTDACENWGGECVEDSWPPSLLHFRQILAETKQSCNAQEGYVEFEIADFDSYKVFDLETELRKQHGVNIRNVYQEQTQIFTKSGVLLDEDYNKHFPSGPQELDFPLRMKLLVTQAFSTACGSAPDECDQSGVAPYKATGWRLQDGEWRGTTQGGRCFHAGELDTPTCSAKSAAAARFCPCKETYESVITRAHLQPVTPDGYDAFDKDRND